MSRFEKHYWRDVALTNWHASRYLHCRAAGVALLLLEYHQGQARAVIEYRRYEDGRPNKDHPTYRAIASVSEPLPFYIVFYTAITSGLSPPMAAPADRHTVWGFCLSPQNHSARQMSGSAAQLLSEAELVDFLYKIRGNPRRPKLFLANQRPEKFPDKPMSVPDFLMIDGAPFPGAEISIHRRDQGAQRGWGNNCPCVDLDFMLIDSNDGTIHAGIEYKRCGPLAFEPGVSFINYWQQRGNTHKPDKSVLAQQQFFKERGVPFHVVRYDYSDDFWRFQIQHPPGTEPRHGDVLSGDEWAEMLWSARQYGHHQAAAE
jgi:hypothetical protein